MDTLTLPPVDQLDRTKPLTDEQYAVIAKLSDKTKAEYMYGFQSEGWSQEDIERHFLAAHFPVVKYHSSGGGGSGTLNPPTSKK